MISIYTLTPVSHTTQRHSNAQVPVSLLACYSCTHALCSNINTMTLVCSRPNHVSSLSPVGSAQGRNQSEMTVASWCNPRQGSILSAAISKRIYDPPQQTLHRKYPVHYVKSYSVYAADINRTLFYFLATLQRANPPTVNGIYHM